MGLGRTWSQGHGQEFALLTRAFAEADRTKMDAFRDELMAGAPIMAARQILHAGLGPFIRRNKFGADLGQWDPFVTQFRWYDHRARFWLPSESKPYQIDAVMRRALLQCCDLWNDGYTDIEFCGVCEREQFRIRYNTIADADGKRARFWLEVPDHWASYDTTGRDDDEGRDVTLFYQDWGVADRPKGAATVTHDVPGGVLTKGDDFDPAKLLGGPILYSVIQWVDGAAGGIEPQGIATLPIPPSEQRRLERMDRLALTAGWTVKPSDAAPAATAAIAASDTALHGVPAVTDPDRRPSFDAGGRGRYGRMLAEGPAPTSDLIDEAHEIAGRMTTVVNDGSPTPWYSDAGYSFLGQFVDHDVTFDSSTSLQRALDPDSLIDFRTPRLDLDSIYGGGPALQPYLYDGGGRFLLRGDIAQDGRHWLDVPRTEHGVAIVVDPRNDQNAVLSQLTVLFLRFHNAVVDGLYPVGLGRAFADAQQEVRWHYQWLLVHHFLPAVIGSGKAASYLWPDGDRPTGPELVAALAGGGLKLSVAGDPWEAFMPVEFSAAAFRFGHSMLRSSYQTVEGGAALPTIDDQSGLLARPFGAVDWRCFVSGLDDPRLVQRSAAIDTNLLAALGDVNRAGLIPAPGADPVSLPERTLLRGLRLRLPTGQMAVQELNRRGYRIRALEPAEMGLDSMRSAEQTPLWYYILREAELTRGGATLGPLGGTLVAEVLLGLLVNDTSSFLHAGWAPPGGDFTFADLVRAAERWPVG